jgi:hypothetical protein
MLARRIVRQTLKAGAVRVDAVQIGLTQARSLGREDDPLAVRRPGAVIIEAALGEKTVLAAAVGIGDVEVGGSGSNAVHQHDVLSAGGERKSQTECRKNFQGVSPGTRSPVRLSCWPGARHGHFEAPSSLLRQPEKHLKMTLFDMSSTKLKDYGYYLRYAT